MKKIVLALALSLAPLPAAAQAANGLGIGPVAVGRSMVECSNPGGCGAPADRGVALVQAPEQSGGVIQLKAFGWMEPYANSLAQALIVVFLGWLGKSKYTQWMDQSARDALEAFAKNSASSLIADGFVHMQGKAVAVPSAALANEVNTAAERIPGAMKRFGLTPERLTQKIVDAIPQVPAGAAIVAAAHPPAVAVGAVAARNDNFPPDRGGAVVNLLARFALGLADVPDDVVAEIDRQLPGAGRLIAAAKKLRPDVEQLEPLVERALPIVERMLPTLKEAWPDVVAILPLAEKVLALASDAK